MPTMLLPTYGEDPRGRQFIGKHLIRSLAGKTLLTLGSFYELCEEPDYVKWM
jgi:hypothetical protein